MTGRIIGRAGGPTGTSGGAPHDAHHHRRPSRRPAHSDRLAARGLRWRHRVRSTHGIRRHERRDGRPSTGTEPSQATGESPDASFPIAIPSFDVSAITKGLENVDSYRISITVNGVEQYKGVVVTKPVLSRDLTVSGGTRIVVIGDEAWVARAASR